MSIRTPGVTLVAMTALAAGACGSVDDGPADDGPPGPVTARALAAVAMRHVDEAPTAAAPLGEDQRVREPAVGVELALPRAEGDNAHLDVVVLPDGDRYWREGECGPAEERCEQAPLDTGGEVVVTWQPEAPESDPGVVRVVVRHDDGSVTTVGFHGPPVPQDRPDDLEVTTLDDLVALATDPDARTTTSSAALAAGDDIGEDVWLDWYGQGNGAPSPAS